MFFPRTDRLELTPERIHGLRISLNAPVICLAGIPSGPARASILIHDEPGGQGQVTIGIRSLRSGDVAVFSFEGEFGDDLPLEVGVDAALSFAESMGFLFDDDELQEPGEGVHERALGLWVELMGAPSAASETPPAELFDHGDLADLTEGFQLEEQDVVHAPLPPEPPQRPAARAAEIELAPVRDTAAPAPLAQRHDAVEFDELELELDSSATGLVLEIAAPGHEREIDLGMEAIELAPVPEPNEALAAAASQATEPEAPLTLDSFDLDMALDEPAASQPPVFARGLLTKFRFGPAEGATPGTSNLSTAPVSDPGAPGSAGEPVHDAEAQAALSRTALGRVRLVKRKAGSGEGTVVRLPPVVRLLTSF